MAMAKENGIDIISARNEVSRVPSRNGNAPYTLLTGSQVLPQRYLIPRDFIEGTDSRISVIRIPSTRTTMAEPITKRVLLKRDSALICPLECLAFAMRFCSSILYSMING